MMYLWSHAHVHFLNPTLNLEGIPSPPRGEPNVLPRGVV